MSSHRDFSRDDPFLLRSKDLIGRVERMQRDLSNSPFMTQEHQQSTFLESCSTPSPTTSSCRLSPMSYAGGVTSTRATSMQSDAHSEDDKISRPHPLANGYRAPTPPWYQPTGQIPYGAAEPAYDTSVHDERDAHASRTGHPQATPYHYTVQGNHPSPVSTVIHYQNPSAPKVVGSSHETPYILSGTVEWDDEDESMDEEMAEPCHATVPLSAMRSTLSPTHFAPPLASPAPLPVPSEFFASSAVSSSCSSSASSSSSLPSSLSPLSSPSLSSHEPTSFSMTLRTAGRARQARPEQPSTPAPYTVEKRKTVSRKNMPIPFGISKEGIKELARKMWVPDFPDGEHPSIICGWEGNCGHEIKDARGEGNVPAHLRDAHGVICHKEKDNSLSQKVPCQWVPTDSCPKKIDRHNLTNHILRKEGILAGNCRLCWVDPLKKRGEKGRSLKSPAPNALPAQFTDNSGLVRHLKVCLDVREKSALEQAKMDGKSPQEARDGLFEDLRLKHGISIISSSATDGYILYAEPLPRLGPRAL